MKTILIARLALLAIASTGVSLYGEDLYVSLSGGCGSLLQATGDLFDQAKQALDPERILARVRAYATGTNLIRG